MCNVKRLIGAQIADIATEIVCVLLAVTGIANGNFDFAVGFRIAKNVYGMLFEMTLAFAQHF